MLRPVDESELSAAVADAAGPLRIQGGGTRPIGNLVGGAKLSTAGLSGITLYDPGALTLVAKAGTPLADVEAALVGEGQRLAFEPMDHRALLGTEGVPTLGGMVAANASGPRRVVVGACRDSLIGVRFVDGMGTVIKNGGRVMKNVTGYDLVKLMAGSWGTLGVLSEVSLKVLPKPETEATLTLHGLDVVEAVKAMATALQSPFEVSGAAHVPDAQGKARTLLRIEGFETQVHYRTGRLVDLLAAFGSVEVETQAEISQAFWRDVRDAKVFAGGQRDVWRISVKPSDAVAVIEALPEADCLLDWGGGLVWLEVEESTDVRARLGAINGHATLMRAGAETLSAFGAFSPQLGPITALSAGLRQKFDPHGILNPGLMGV